MTDARMTDIQEVASQRIAAATRARKWLKRTPRGSPSEHDLRQLGVALCDGLVHCSGRSLAPAALAVPLLPASAYELIELPRTELLALCRRLRSADTGELTDQTSQLPDFSAVLAGLAVSYARVNDIGAVAVLVAVGYRAGVSACAMREAESYLLEQQHDDGYFGLLAAERTLVPTGDISGALLLLTIDVLWALTEANAAGARQLHVPGGSGVARP